MQEMWVWSLDWEDTLEKETATHSSILAWEIPWTEEPGGLQFMGSQRVQCKWATENTHTHVVWHLCYNWWIIFNWRSIIDIRVYSLLYCFESLVEWIITYIHQTNSTQNCLHWPKNSHCPICFFFTLSFSSPGNYWTFYSLHNFAFSNSWNCIV